MKTTLAIIALIALYGLAGHVDQQTQAKEQRAITCHQQNGAIINGHCYIGDDIKRGA